MSEFRCPQCGGSYFGTVNIGKLSETVVCHCDTNGGSLSMFRPDGTLRKVKEIGKPCGWRGTWQEVRENPVDIPPGVL